MAGGDITIEYGKAFTGDSEFDLGRDIALRGVDELKLHQLLPEVREALEQVIEEEARQMRDRAVALASGQVLKERTGRFVASIKSEVRSTPTSVMGSVYTDDPRAPIFEYGGEQAARDILPSVAKALRFMGGSAGEVFAAIVHRPAVTYPPHPIIHAAFEQMEGAKTKTVGDMTTTTDFGLENKIEAATHAVIIHTGGL